MTCRDLGAAERLNPPPLAVGRSADELDERSSLGRMRLERGDLSIEQVVAQAAASARSATAVQGGSGCSDQSPISSLTDPHLRWKSAVTVAYQRSASDRVEVHASVVQRLIAR